MIKLIVPNTFLPERLYVADFIFKHSFGLSYQAVPSETMDYRIEFPSGKTLTLKDAFFGTKRVGDNYRRKSCLPKAPAFMRNRFTPEADMPVIYGTNELHIEANSIFCGLDIFGSIFFLLTRWEESLIDEKDRHGRVSESKMYLVKHNLYHRLPADEYLTFLKSLMSSFGINNFKEPEYRPYFTHDVDTLYKYKKLWKLIRLSGGDLIKRRSLSGLLRTWQEYYALKTGKSTDPYDTYDYFMDVSERFGQKSYFYFMPGMPGESDLRYYISDKRVALLIKQIESRGHVIGIHASYDSHDKAGQFQAEIDRLNALVKQQVTQGRHHYLRFENPATWRSWNEAGMMTDSTIGFRHRIGFRAGTASTYPVFDIDQRRVLSLCERPLAVMDVALLDIYPEPEDGLRAVEDLAKRVKKYGGDFVLLWHNDNIKSPLWDNYGKYYEKFAEAIHS